MNRTGDAVRSDRQAGDGESADPGRLRKHSVMIAGHRTSISIEDAFWHALGRAARRRGETVTGLVTRIDASRTGNLSSAIRVFILAELEEMMSAQGGVANNPL